MSKKRRRIFSREFKLSAIERMLGGESTRALSRELRVDPKHLHKWCHRFRVPDRGSGNPTPLGGVGQRHYPCRLKGWKRTNGAAILFGTASTIRFG
jgi:transposase-like protein